MLLHRYSTFLAAFAILVEISYTHTVKIGAVPYVNARPLTVWFEHEPHAEMTVHYDVPSRLVEKLRAGHLDLAMVSTFCALEHPGFVLLTDVGVAVAGSALSVRLFSRVPVSTIRTLALDADSRSSNVLARIILADRYGCVPDCLLLSPDLDSMLENADAAVVIGDLGLSIRRHDLIELDLGWEWHSLTGLPFFFAGWVARNQEVAEMVAPVVSKACEYGLAHLDELALGEAERLELPLELCREYLIEIMHYHIGKADLAGLEEFRRRAVRLGLLSDDNDTVTTVAEPCL